MGTICTPSQTYRLLDTDARNVGEPSYVVFLLLCGAFSERIILFDRKILKKRRSRMAKKLVMFALKWGGCFPESNISTSHVRWNKTPPTGHIDTDRIKQRDNPLFHPIGQNSLLIPPCFYRNLLSHFRTISEGVKTEKIPIAYLYFT
jgi:hypothetical protein